MIFIIHPYCYRSLDYNIWHFLILSLFILVFYMFISYFYFDLIYELFGFSDQFIFSRKYLCCLLLTAPIIIYILKQKGNILRSAQNQPICACVHSSGPTRSFGRSMPATFLGRCCPVPIRIDDSYHTSIPLQKFGLH